MERACKLCAVLQVPNGTCSGCELQRDMRRALAFGWIACVVLSTVTAVACKVWFP